MWVQPSSFVGTTMAAAGATGLASGEEEPPLKIGDEFDNLMQFNDATQRLLLSQQKQVQFPSAALPSLSYAVTALCALTRSPTPLRSGEHGSARVNGENDPMPSLVPHGMH